MDFAFPPELSDAPRRLYHLRRGPLLSPGPVQSADDRVEVRTLFVRFPLSDCLSMMAPSLWSSGPLAEAMARNAPSLQNVPPETLALWENVREFSYRTCSKSINIHFLTRLFLSVLLPLIIGTIFLFGLEKKLYI